MSEAGMPRVDGKGEAGPPEPGSGGEPARPRRGGVRRAVGFAWEWTRSIFVAFVLFLIIRTFVVEAFKIPTSSMENTLLVGDFLLVNKAVYGAEIPETNLHLPAFEEPKRSDVIVFHPPIEPDLNYVKRVVGVGGDTLEMRHKVLYVNGHRKREPYARYMDRTGDAVHPAMSWQYGYLITSLRASHIKYHPSRDNWGPLVVPPGKFFVLGDNRDNSEDSRYWGFVDRDEILGRPVFVYYAFDPSIDHGFPWLDRVRWGRIGEPIE